MEHRDDGPSVQNLACGIGETFIRPRECLHYFERISTSKETTMIRCAWMMSVLVMVATLATAADNAWLATPGQSARTWTPKLASQVAWQSAMDATKKTPKGKLRGNQCIGFARGKAFQGTLLRLQGLQTSRSHRMVVIRLADGTIRSWPVNSFSPADQAYLRPFIRQSKGSPHPSRPQGLTHGGISGVQGQGQGQDV